MGAHLGLGDAVIKGIDFPLHADPAAYREAVAFIKADPLSLGALVTTHKIDLFNAARDLFDVVDPHASLMKETSCLSKRNSRLICHAKDPISSGLALDGFLPPDHFAQTGAEVLSMGAGGSTIALTWHLMRRERSQDVPSRIVVTDRCSGGWTRSPTSTQSSDHRCRSNICWRIGRTQRRGDGRVEAGSLVINATGLGKDVPGSPITDAGLLSATGHSLGPQLSGRSRLP